MTEKDVVRAARRGAVEELATAGDRARESVAVARHAYGLVQALREGDGLNPSIELTQLAAQVHQTSMDGYRQVSRDAARWEQRARSILAHHERAFNATRERTMTTEHPPQDTPADTADPAPSAPEVMASTRRIGGLCAEMITRQRAAAAGMSRSIAQTQQAFAAQYQLGDAVRTQVLTQHERTMAEATAQIQALQAAAVVAMQGTREGR